MRIAHITDMHIGRPGEYVDDVDVCTNFINVLSSVTDYGVDHIVLGGDLCYRDALPETYEWIYERIVESSLPFSITPGNHDDTDLLGKVFSIGTFDSVYTIGSVPVLFLDTAHAQLSGEQLKNADDTIQRHNIRTVFMHHPPALCHVPHMDAKYPLVNHDEVLGLFVKRGIRHVFCGHYHLEKQCTVDGVAIHITPSTFFQLDDNSEGFALLTHTIGWRIIELDGDNLYTRIQWL